VDETIVGEAGERTAHGVRVDTQGTGEVVHPGATARAARPLGALGERLEDVAARAGERPGHRRRGDGPQGTTRRHRICHGSHCNK